MNIESRPPQDDYLWDRSGPVDAEVERLERLLAPLGLRDPPPPALPMPRRPRRRRWTRLLALAAVMAGVLLGGHRWYTQRLHWPTGSGWDTRLVAGQAQLDGRRLPDAASLQPGDVIETAANGVAKVQVARIGEMVLGNDSRLRLVLTRAGRHRVQLDRGTLWARIWAPPGSFGVAVPAGEAIDLGCEFLISTDAAGNGLLRVQSGWVQFEDAGVEVLVPQGAQVELHAQGLPGTPYASDAAPAFVATLRQIDAQNGVDADEAVQRLLATTRPADAITLVSLLARYPEVRTGPVFDRAAQLLPADVTREDLIARGPNALDPWWRALPYPPIKRWWLQWPDALRATGNAQSKVRHDPP